MRGAEPQKKTFPGRAWERVHSIKKSNKLGSSVPLCVCASILLCLCAFLPLLGCSDGSGEDPESGPEPLQIFFTYGYPVNLAVLLLDVYLLNLGAVHVDRGHWTYPGSEEVAAFELYVDNTPEGFSRALTTPDAIVVWFGHSNFGLGLTFDSKMDHSAVGKIQTIDDFYNIAPPQVAVNIRHMRETHAYPNLEFRESDIVKSPKNYIIPDLDIERFPNIDGVGPGETFRYLRGEGYDRYHYMADRGPGDFFPMLVVRGGAADLPTPLRYRIFFFHGCFTGHYFGELFRHGVLFYTLATANEPTEWVFLDGVIRGQPYDQIKDRLNARENVYDYHVYD